MSQTVFKSRILTRVPLIIQQTRNIVSSLPRKSNKVPEEVIPKNILEKFYSAHKQPPGEIYDKRPFKMTLQANKKYAWCSCGHSKSQPLCDGTHRVHPLGIKNRPVFFMVEETKEYWLCNCKQTHHRPFCDGTHQEEKIQSSSKYFKN